MLLDKTNLSDRQKFWVRTIADGVFLAIMVFTFVYANNVYQARYNICANPNKYCPHNYIMTEKTANVSIPDTPFNVIDTEPNATKINESYMECLEKCDCMNGPSFMWNTMSDK